MNPPQTTLTPKQRRVIDALKAEGGPISSGYLCDYAGIAGRGIGTVLHHLERKGLIEFGGWWDEEHGHDVLLTEAGEAA